MVLTRLRQGVNILKSYCLRICLRKLKRTKATLQVDDNVTMMEVQDGKEKKENVHKSAVKIIKQTSMHARNGLQQDGNERNIKKENMAAFYILHNPGKPGNAKEVEKNNVEGTSFHEA